MPYYDFEVQPQGAWWRTEARDIYSASGIFTIGSRYRAGSECAGYGLSETLVYTDGAIALDRTGNPVYGSCANVNNSIINLRLSSNNANLQSQDLTSRVTDLENTVKTLSSTLTSLSNRVTTLENRTPNMSGYATKSDLDNCIKKTDEIRVDISQALKTAFGVK